MRIDYICCIKRGFTLIELLIAISIMAFIAVISYITLDGMLRSQQQLSQKDSMLKQLQRSYTQWQSDCQNLETSAIPSLFSTYNLQIINNAVGNMQGVWLIRRNFDYKVSTWQLIKYVQYNNYIYRIAFNNTANAEQLLQDINYPLDFSKLDIQNFDELSSSNPTNIFSSSVKMLEVSSQPALRLNIWYNNSWQNLAQVSTVTENLDGKIKGLQLNIKLNKEWQDLGDTQTFNCLLTNNL